ncbi:hypothetical protein D3C72_2229420 [compost metagenome]
MYAVQWQTLLLVSRGHSHQAMQYFHLALCLKYDLLQTSALLSMPTEFGGNVRAVLRTYILHFFSADKVQYQISWQ